MARKKHWVYLVAQQIAGHEMPQDDNDTEASLTDTWNRAVAFSGTSEDLFTARAAEYFGIAVADLQHVDPQAITLVPEEIARKYQVLPMLQDNSQLIVATSDPAVLEVEQTLRFVSGRMVTYELASPLHIRSITDASYLPELAIDNLLDNISTDGSAEPTVETSTAAESVTERDVAHEPLIKLTNLILTNALRVNVSDIHIEPGQGAGVVRFRVDGELRIFSRLKMQVLSRVCSRIKILANLDVANRQRPQDGRFRVRVNRISYDIRVSTVPVRGGESVVMRIAYPEKSDKIGDLRLAPNEVKRLRRMISRKDSMTLVTGPTGSGKTTTLYAILRDLMGEKVNIMTVEDPVEYELEGITQIQIEPKSGVTFPGALRAILRQDPDIILIGEIRDTETAAIAVQAGQTGHLVLATLHTKDAVGVFSRLKDLGLTRRALRDSISGIVCQRLVRLLCPKCKVPCGNDLTSEESDLAQRYGIRPVERAVGCDECSEIGYHGRQPVVESLLVSDLIRDLINQENTSTAIRDAAVTEGMNPLLNSALDLVAEGKTTLQEVDRVFGEEGDAIAPATIPIDEGVNEPKVLVVDDDAMIRRLSTNVLRKAGYQCAEASNGVEALKQLSTHPDYDLMLLDINMPEMDGIEVLKRVRSSMQSVGLPVVVLTASETQNLEVELMNLGADDYIRKPLDPSLFVARIKGVLRRAGH